MKNIYLVGIKGVGMAALAVYLKERGKCVWGSDVAENFPTDAVLSEHNIKIVTGFKPENITDNIDLVVTTGAHGGLNNIEVVESKKQNIPVMTLAQEIGHLSQDYKTVISVCGNHGKTTTSALLAFILNKLEKKASHLVGTPKFSGLSGGHLGGEDYLVVEGDEYIASPGSDNTPRFMYQDPDIIICTNIDFDHPDAFADLEAVKRAYRQFFKKTLSKPNGKLIYCIEDQNLRDVIVGLPPEKLISYGFSDSADLVIHFLHNEGAEMVYAAHLVGKADFGTFKIKLSGLHNVLNSAAILLCSAILNFNMEKIKKILPEFTGLSRRFEKKYSVGKTVLIDDYAHHPRELEATINGARDVYPKSRIILVFQPHTHSRTEALMHRFIDSLSLADRAFVVDTYVSARQYDNTLESSSKNIADHAKASGKESVVYLPDRSLKEVLSSVIRKGDIIITAGAGDIYKYHQEIKEIINGLKIKN